VKTVSGGKEYTALRILATKAIDRGFPSQARKRTMFPATNSAMEITNDNKNSSM
jgi:hypothetical protein